MAVTTFALGLSLLAAAPLEELRLPVTRDTWFSGIGSEADGNNGGAPTVKLKSFQEMAVVDFDPGPLRGRVVVGATLHLKLSAEPVLKRVTVGTFGAPWVEGTSRSYQPEAGASTYRRQKHPDVAWTPDGGDLCRVILGQGGTLWRMADASPPDADRWQTVPVDPAVVATRVAGVSHGFLLFDDTGTEWTRRGESFTTQHMPNRFVFSHDAPRANAPYFVVKLGAVDRSRPPAPGGVRSETGTMPVGEAVVSWDTPTDVGPAGVAGFFATVDGRPVPQSLVPSAGVSGARVKMHLRDLNLPAGGEVVLTVRAADGAGNVSHPATAKVRVSAKTPAPLPGKAPSPVPVSEATGPRLGAASVSVVDELDKVNPVDGRIAARPRGYPAANHLWSAGESRVRLHSARNEFVAFQVVIRSRERDLKASLDFEENGRAIKAEFGRYFLVDSKLGPLADPIVTLGGPEDQGVEFEKAGYQSLHAEVYVPHGVPPGEHRGTLTLTSRGDSLKLAVSLIVWDFTLPDHLSFLPEMNCYGLPDNERDFYRLAHRHRTVLNRVPYSQNGTVADGFAPARPEPGGPFDWSAWDRRFGPLFDGSAFADLPRKGVPIECFYLPLHENWPTAIEPNYDGGYWADRAFTPAYRRAFVDASRQFAAHTDERRWSETIFQCFFNGKLDFKKEGWSRGSSPWLLDEPANFQDFWALRYFGAAFHEGVKQAAPRSARLAFRCDISRPEWQRDALDGLLDYNVVGGAMRSYRRIVLDRKEAETQVVVEYGSANPVEESNVQAVAWSLDAWTLGVDGVLPWQTVGRGDSWLTADTLALFYPGRRGKEPVPSVRLKAFRRGQQDVEYLTLLAQATGQPRWAVARQLRAALGLSGERGASGTAGGEDAGTVRYAGLSPADLWALRVRLGRALSELHPAPKRKLVDFRTPPRDPSRLAPREVAGPAR